VFVWDEVKRKWNIVFLEGLASKFPLSVNADKCTYQSSRKGERRLMDLAFALVNGRLLALVYVERGDDVRVISFRPASREEREQYEQGSI
jgi:uncharacterized DUF497 family protein